MARRRRATWMLVPPNWRISVTARWTKSSQSGRPVDEPQPARRIAHAPVVQAAAADVAEEVMDLVDGQDRGGRVVDRRREPLGGDVHDDPEREGRVLLQGAFLAEGDRLAQRVRRRARRPPWKTRNRGSPAATKSPTCGTSSMTQSARSARATSPRTSKARTTPSRRLVIVRRRLPVGAVGRAGAGVARLGQRPRIDAFDDLPAQQGDRSAGPRSAAAPCRRGRSGRGRRPGSPGSCRRPGGP